LKLGTTKKVGLNQKFSLTYFIYFFKFLVFRSEKHQNHVDIKNQMHYDDLFEKCHEKLSSENFRELQRRVEKIKASRAENLKNLKIDEICDILDYGGESNRLPTQIVEELSQNKMNKIQENRLNRSKEVNEKVKRKIKDMECSTTSKLLKFRVVDFVNPMKTALINFWHPNEEIECIIKKGNCLDFYNVNAIKYGSEINIHTDIKSSFVKQAKVDSAKDKFDKYFRKETKLCSLNKEFNPGEFDIACIIVAILDTNVSKLKQEIFVADDNKDEMNFLCINFIPNLQEHGCDDLREGDILYMCNLNWRKSFREGDVIMPEAFASELTSFLINPRDDAQRTRIKEFEANIGSEKNEYRQKCKTKLNELVCIPDNVKANDIIPQTLKKSTSKRTLGLKKASVLRFN
jgi:hypothetical protein